VESCLRHPCGDFTAKNIESAEKMRKGNARKIYLASKSPRRRELLERVGIPFEVVERDSVPLPKFDPENPADYAIKLALAKAKAAKAPDDAIVLGCDTIVVQRLKLLEKPADETQAKYFLTRLADDWHQVFTGIALYEPSTGREESDCEMTRVHFGPLSEEEIDAYIATGEPMDKAGAYGIQEKGALLIREIRGDYFNVVGLPLFRLTVLLARFNIFVENLIECG